MRRIIAATILLTLGALIGPTSTHAAVLVRDYELNGSYADALGGRASTIVFSGISEAGTVYAIEGRRCATQ